MKFEISSQGWTILTKENCSYCKRVKTLVPEATFIESDGFLKENRDLFLKKMDSYTGKEHRTFPMVFLDKRFIGGYSETKKYIDEMDAFDMVDF